ncbi:MAG: LysR family transcriptional regulator substrate-binding protein, partial [Methylobacterium organophilum]|nr:LysR family transcriptional regulator substrate-binding protein [Methylobacterium organophilum]
PIAEIAKFVPGLRVEFRQESTEKLLELLLGGKVSAAIAGDIQDMPARIDNWPLFAERYVAVVALNHDLAKHPAIDAEQLRSEIILARAGCDVAPKIWNWGFAGSPPKLGHRSEHEVHLQHLVAAGFGVILAPEHMPHLPTLKTVPIEGDPIWREVRLLAMQGRRYSPALDAFVKVARQWDWAPEDGLDRRPPATGRHEAVGVAV